MNELKDVLGDESKLWSKMKSLANDGKVRLVTAQELSEWKKKLNGGIKPNGKPPSLAANRPPKRGRVTQDEVNPDAVDIAPSHFVVDDDQCSSPRIVLHLMKRDFA